MSDLVITLIDARLEQLSKAAEEIHNQRTELITDRDRILRLAKRDDAPAKPAKARVSKARKPAGGPTVKDQILAYLRERGEPARIAQIVEATGAKNTTVNGTLHQLKKAGQVSLTVDGWAIGVLASNSNSAAEAHA